MVLELQVMGVWIVVEGVDMAAERTRLGRSQDLPLVAETANAGVYPPLH